VALTITLLEMRTRAKRRAHMENGGPVDDDEWDDLLNSHVRELHRLLTQAFGAEYFKTSATLSTTANVKTVDLPADFNKLISLWWNDGSGVPKRMRRATEEEMERQLIGGGWSPWARGMRSDEDDWPRYAVRAGKIEFIPTPTAVYSLILNYAPPAVELVDDDDTLDGYNGYEQYPIWMAAADAIAKEEGDASYQLSMANRIAADIVTTAERDQSEPLTIQDTTGWWGE
jgi:hypothetical protein